MMSKTIKIPCPAHRLSQLLSSEEPEPTQVEISKIQEPVKQKSIAEFHSPEIKDSQPESPFDSLNEEIIQEANVSSN